MKLKNLTLVFLSTILMSCSNNEQKTQEQQQTNTQSSAPEQSGQQATPPSTSSDRPPLPPSGNATVPPASNSNTAPASTTPASTTPAQPAKFDATKEYTISMETSLGTMKLKLYPNVAPKTVENFVTLANKGYYDSLIFHRVIDGFMIQGGDPTGTGMGGESIFGAKFEDEVSDKVQFDRAGLLAMANAGPNTNGSQFFITLGATPHLNMKHTIFGEVIEGMDVLRKIGSTKTGAQDRPVENVVMKKVKTL